MDIKFEEQLNYNLPLIDKAIGYLVSRGIKSRIAIFNIIGATTSSSSKMSLQEGTDLWISYKDKIVKIDWKVEDVLFGKKRVDRDKMFVASVLNELIFFEDKFGSPFCLFSSASRNFIVALRSGKCNCNLIAPQTLCPCCLFICII